MNLVAIADELARKLRGLRFAPPVEYVYDPLEYARETHLDYLRKYGGGRKETVLLGMNPGPWGMAQTGVPFGQIGLVRDWLKINGRIDRPVREHPARPIDGFNCSRNEVSGARLWGWARDRFGTPGSFFNHFFVANYCPLVFMEGSGRNRTPDMLPAVERARVEAVCDDALRRTVRLLEPRYVIGIGGFAERRAKVALTGFDLAVGRILHPSPASPAANRGWAKQAEQALRAIGISLPQ